MPKKSRQNLVPIVLSHGKLKHIDFLNRYNHLLSDYIMCIQPFREAIERLVETFPAKKIIPIIKLSDSENDPDIFSKYIDYILEKANSFEKILIGMENLEIHNTSTFVLEDIEKAFSGFAGKMIVSHSSYHLHLQSIISSKSLDKDPLRRFLLRTGTVELVFNGWQCIYNNVNELISAGFEDREPLFFRARDINKDNIPNFYWHSYINSGIECWSGIGGEKGVNNHHFSRLIDYGYKKCIFYASQINNLDLLFEDVEE